MKTRKTEPKDFQAPVRNVVELIAAEELQLAKLHQAAGPVALDREAAEKDRRSIAYAAITGADAEAHGQLETCEHDLLSIHEREKSIAEAVRECEAKIAALKSEKIDAEQQAARAELDALHAELIEGPFAQVDRGLELVIEGLRQIWKRNGQFMH